MKAISPMIAVVLLIAFTVAVGGILSVWLSTLSTTQTTTVTSSTEKQVKCSSVNLVVKDVRVNISSIGGGAFPGKYANVTLKYESGTATLTPNVTVEVFWRGERNATSSTTDLVPGESHVVSVNVSRTFPSNASVSSGLLSAPELVRVRTWCETNVPIIAECRIDEPCMTVIT